MTDGDAQQLPPQLDGRTGAAQPTPKPPIPDQHGETLGHILAVLLRLEAHMFPEQVQRRPSGPHCPDHPYQTRTDGKGNYSCDSCGRTNGRYLYVTEDRDSHVPSSS